MKPDDKRRFFERNLKRSMPGARLVSVKITPEDVRDTSTGLRAELEFSAEDMTALGDRKAVVNLPWMGKGLGIVNFILGGAGLEQRKYPLRTEIACGLSEEISIQLGEGFSGTVSMPSYLSFEDNSLSYQRQIEITNGTLACSTVLKLKTVEFAPKEYAKLKSSLKAMDYDERKEPVLAASVATIAKSTAPNRSDDPRVESNAQINESHKTIEIKDAHAQVLKAKYIKKVLNYSGKKNEAEFKFAYNPACEEAKLIGAVVISKGFPTLGQTIPVPSQAPSTSPTGATPSSSQSTTPAPQLSPRQQATVLLTYWDDLAPRDVAQRLGISEGSVRRHLARARARLRRVLDA